MPLASLGLGHEWIQLDSLFKLNGIMVHVACVKYKRTFKTYTLIVGRRVRSIHEQ